ncbi:hypothetical protein EDD22DRAFT_958614 [Suillus occidentalis]|nr:hypothetical protein EDD22DRAFT_959637 [Suillus occidentalis]KAG1744725.1 hypothetical protein EDD22DRAFT_958614 [Suillus occidentalis]
MFDPAKKSQGCLRGYYLKRVHFSYHHQLNATLQLAQVFHHIFTGPSSALNPNARRGTKTPKGRIHGMTSPLPRAIAYAAVQAYFQLSSVNIWCQEIEDLDLVDLYDRVVDMFEGNTNSKWVEETLQHWKSLLDFSNVGTLGPRDTGSRVDDDDSEDDMDGFFDSEEHSPDAGNGGNDGSTGDGVPTRTDSNVDDMNGINFSLHSCLL